MKPRTGMLLSLGTASLLVAGAQLAQAGSAELPPVRTANGIDYLSGGIGKDEAHAVERAAARWPLMMEFMQIDHHRTAFTADVSVRVRDAQGLAVFQTRSDGPLLLARLKPGRYTIEATASEETLRRSVTVRASHTARISFVWPQDKRA
jgi:hypothetical protein